MKADMLSTLSQRDVGVSTIGRMQRRLVDAQTEVSTGRHADVGVALGGKISQTLQARGLAEEVRAIKYGNEVVEARLATGQLSLSSIGDMANDFMSLAVSLRQGGSDRALLTDRAAAMLGSLSALVNASSGGAFVFAGVNAGVAPLGPDLADAGGPSRTAVAASFAAEFGFASSDPATRAITPAQMQSYLDGGFSALFDDPGWSANFSSASDEAMRDRISVSETIESTASANSRGIRDLMKALMAAVGTGVENLSADTFAVVVDNLISATGAAVAQVADMQSKLGLSQERLAKATERNDLTLLALERTVAAHEEIDAYEAAVRLNSARAQLETSYAVTARLQGLSLLNYL